MGGWTLPTPRIASRSSERGARPGSGAVEPHRADLRRAGGNTPLTPLALKLSTLQRLAAEGRTSPEVLRRHLEAAQRRV